MTVKTRETDSSIALSNSGTPASCWSHLRCDTARGVIVLGCAMRAYGDRSPNVLGTNTTKTQVVSTGECNGADS
jgi:hypothetical protein